MFSYRFRTYPLKTIQAKLQEYLESCEWLYNRLLEELSRAKKKNRKIIQKDKDTQAFIIEARSIFQIGGGSSHG